MMLKTCTLEDGGKVSVTSLWTLPCQRVAILDVGHRDHY